MSPRTPVQVLDRAMSEDELLTAVTDALTMFGYRWTHHRRSDRAQLMGHRGFPDVFAVGHGRILALELKSETGHVDADQIGWKIALEPAGVDWRLVRPRDLDELLVELAR